jgi:hypothetical protein
MGKARANFAGCEYFRECRNAAFRPEAQFIHSLLGAVFQNPAIGPERRWGKGELPRPAVPGGGELAVYADGPFV